MGERAVSASKLAMHLGERLAAAVPYEVAVSVEGAVVSIRPRGTPWGISADLRPPSDRPHPPTPEGVHIEVDALNGSASEVDDEMWRAIAPWAERSPVIELDDVPSLLESVLDQIQDEVAETIGEPWPAVAPGPFPEPFVELRDDRLLGGYGDPAHPDLTVLSASLRDLS